MSGSPRESGKLLPFRRAASSPEAMSDQALVAAIGVGDGSALGTLFDRYHRAVYRFLARVSSSSANDLDDLVQATFVEVNRAAARFRGHSAVRTWVLGIASNVGRHHVRGESRRRGLVAHAAELPQRTAGRPDQTVEQSELMERIAEALAALPHDLRVAFVMCDLEEVAGVDAARVLDVRAGTLWRRLHEARKRLRAALEEVRP